MHDQQPNIIASPCVRNCCLNEQNICLGCFRTLDEICSWSQADTAIRKQILLNCAIRRDASGRIELMHNPLAGSDSF